MTKPSMKKQLTIKKLYLKLEKFGVPKKWVKKYGIPNWWDKELEDNPAAILELTGYICKRFGLDLKSVLEENEVKFKWQIEAKLKSPK